MWAIAAPKIQHTVMAKNISTSSGVSRDASTVKAKGLSDAAKLYSDAARAINFGLMPILETNPMPQAQNAITQLLKGESLILAWSMLSPNDFVDYVSQESHEHPVLPTHFKSWRGVHTRSKSYKGEAWYASLANRNLSRALELYESRVRSLEAAQSSVEQAEVAKAESSYEELKAIKDEIAAVRLSCSTIVMDIKRQRKHTEESHAAFIESLPKLVASTLEASRNIESPSSNQATEDEGTLPNEALFTEPYQVRARTPFEWLMDNTFGRLKFFKRLETDAESSNPYKAAPR